MFNWLWGFLARAAIAVRVIMVVTQPIWSRVYDGELSHADAIDIVSAYWPNQVNDPITQQTVYKPIRMPWLKPLQQSIPVRARIGYLVGAFNPGLGERIRAGRA